MGRFRSLLCLGALLWASASAADGRFDHLRHFNICAGTYTAALEHAWLVGDPASARLERERSAFIDMIDALAPSGAAVPPDPARIEARAAHRALLSRAVFGPRDEAAAWAEDRAEARIWACRALLLGS